MTWAGDKFEEIWFEKSHKYEEIFEPGCPRYDSTKKIMVELLNEAFEAGQASVDNIHGCVVR